MLLLGAVGVEFAFRGGTFFPLYPCVRCFVCGTERGVSLFLFMWNLQLKDSDVVFAVFSFLDGLCFSFLSLLFPRCTGVECAAACSCLGGNLADLAT